ncbi:MAG: hypothetical protein FJX34_05370 [Alphaproteobacteria bacterium]|nr:hypothetical protein [Alphaproteobacteria bacterium]
MKISSLITLLFLLPNIALAWNGYDYDNKTAVEIGPGKLVRKGLLIEFYDSKLDKYHTAKVMFVESIAGGTRIQLIDLDSGEEITLIMQEEKNDEK